MEKTKRVGAGLLALCGLGVAILFLYALVKGGFGAGPLIGIAVGVGVAIWQGRRALGIQGKREKEGEEEWF